MSQEDKNILAVNGGSSSIKFAVYGTDGARAGENASALTKKLSGKIDRIGMKEATLTFTDILNNGKGSLPADAAGPEEAAVFLLDWLGRQKDVLPLAAIGHRVVHGMQHRQAMPVDDGLLDELQSIRDYDPDHLPGEIGLIRLFRRHSPDLPQFACFDTAFHAGLPRVAKLLPIPRRYDGSGIQRYGFHGLSYAYILEDLARVEGAAIANGRVIIAHLGSGASMAAVRNGCSVDTTMGFTPTGGIMMGTRTGDLDPGVAWYILQKEQLTAAGFNDLVNHRSGLLGVSETSSDMQDLLAREKEDIRAAEAIALFCYQVKKTIGAFSAVLGGVDTLVFTGGIGERAAVIRSRICGGLEYLGIGLDEQKNKNNERVISAPGGRTGVYAIPTDEEQMIARTVYNLLKDH
ncbi:MAG TPA: acetate/propionate family kinase [Puia sp.]|jgi:acetate kinase